MEILGFSGQMAGMGLAGVIIGSFDIILLIGSLYYLIKRSMENPSNLRNLLGLVSIIIATSAIEIGIMFFLGMLILNELGEIQGILHEIQDTLRENQEILREALNLLKRG